jgi:hypothetical protein
MLPLLLLLLSLRRLMLPLLLLLLLSLRRLMLLPCQRVAQALLQAAAARPRV